MSDRLPQGWNNVELKELVIAQKGKKPDVLRESPMAGFVPYLDIHAIEKNEVRQFAEVKSSRLATKNDLFVVWDGARSGWVGSGISGAVGSTIMALTPQQMTSDYLRHFIAGKFQTINTNTKGTGIPHVDPEVFWSLAVPLAPLPEQRRIVTKLEKLLSKVYACETRLAKIPLILKRFRQSILAAACSGRLTADWREKNGILPSVCHSERSEESRLQSQDKLGEESRLMQRHGQKQTKGETLRFTQGDNKTPGNHRGLPLQDTGGDLPEGWTVTILKDAADMRLGKMLDKSKNLGEPTPYLRNINVRWFNVDLSGITLMRATADDKKELSIRNGDLLVCEGGEPGRCAVWNIGDNAMIFQKAIHRIRPAGTVSPHWLQFNLCNDANSGRLAEYFTGTTIKHLTGKALASYAFPLPPLPEQREIVRRAEALFSLADQIEARYIKAKAYVDKITQSILAKAFRGELVPQDPNDEPASVLLERIKEERSKAQQTATIHRTRKRKRDSIANTSALPEAAD